MKITKTINEVRKHSLARDKANEGCDKCPGCGNTKILITFDIAERGLSEDCITKMTFRVEKSTLFTYKTGNVDKYRCNRCATEWESEIY